MEDKLEAWLNDGGKLAVIGIGNEMKGDDGVGINVAERLKKDKKCEILIGGTTPENLTGTIKKIKPSHILIIDAADMGLKPGEMKVLDPGNISGVGFSTHSFSISTFSDYLKRETGAKTAILGIQPKSIELGGGISDEVARSADAALVMLERILKKIRSLC